VARVLERSLVSHTHLNAKEKHIAHHFKGGAARNAGILYIRALKEKVHPDSVVYFAGMSCISGL